MWKQSAEQSPSPPGTQLAAFSRTAQEESRGDVLNVALIAESGEPLGSTQTHAEHIVRMKPGYGSPNTFRPPLADDL
ncbi:unnamed protein product [Lota lota]